jgi:thiol:disulfide interchange protein
VRKIEMRLEREEFVVTFDATRASVATLLATIKAAGYTAQMVDKRVAATQPMLTTLPSGFALLDEALAQTRAENKLLVLDFTAAWCAPCQRMEKTTFVDARVTALLQRCVLLRIDTDAQPELAQKLGVVGLPDIRLVTPEGSIVRQLRGWLNAEALAIELEAALKKLGQH